MDHLSSCYFCGAALDEPLGAYSLDAAGGGRSVTLCASCRHKLDTLLEANDFDPTVPAHDTDTRPDSADTTPATSSEEAEPAPPDTDPSTADETASTEPPTPDESVKSESEPELGEMELEPDDTETDPTPDAEEETAEQSSDTDAGTEDAIAPGRVAEPGPEPVTTDPEELPDDEEVKVVPGLATEADEPAEESSLSEQMEPTVPDAFGEFTDEEADTEEPDPDEAPATALDSSTEDLELDSDGLTADADNEADDDMFGDTDGVDTTPIDAESTVEDDLSNLEEFADQEADLGTTEESTSEPAEGGVDPSILQADEIATGNADIEDVLGDDGDVPDGLENATPDDPSESASPDTASETEPVAEEDEPFDIDAADEPEVAAEPGDGGFEFDNRPDTDDEELHSEMEPDIPDEFSSTAEEIADATAGDADAEEPAEEEITFEGQDSSDELQSSGIDNGPEIDSDVGDPDDTDEQQSHSPEEIAFGDSDLAESTDEPPSEPDTIEGNETQAETDSDRAGDSAETDAEDRRSISALEYNKVMRLLQNREFPVDRMELLAVAASTYDLSQAECEAVLDIAVERGLLAEDGDKLVKPD